MKYAIYMRVSTDEQDVSTQEYHCREYVHREAKSAAYNAEVFSDPDTSSRIPMEKRTGLQAMLNSLKKNDIVVVQKLDRLSRDVIEMVTIYRMIKAKKSFVHSLSEANCDNEFMMGLMGTMAQKERSDISDRTKRALQAKKSRGERVGRIPFGYRLAVDQIHIEPCPIEQGTLALLCKLHKRGYSYRALEEYCDENKIRTREGGKYYHRQLWVILKNLHPDYTSDVGVPSR